MTFVDTNIILRWILKDDEKLFKNVDKLISQAPLQSLIITDIITSELVYVLNAYDYSRLQISEALTYLLRVPCFQYENEEIILATLRQYATINLDFADCYLLVRSKRESKQITTLDRKLTRLSAH